MAARLAHADRLGVRRRRRHRTADRARSACCCCAACWRACRASAAALLRLARNDTSIDIPGLNHQDEVGQLARSVAVFKAKSIELLQKKGEFERLNLQLDAAINNMPLGLSMFDAQGRLLVCNRHFADMYGLPSELTQPGTAHCALWDHRAQRRRAASSLHRRGLHAGRRTSRRR